MEELLPVHESEINITNYDYQVVENSVKRSGNLVELRLRLKMIDKAFTERTIIGRVPKVYSDYYFFPVSAAKKLGGAVNVVCNGGIFQDTLYVGDGLSVNNPAESIYVFVTYYTK